MSYLLEPGATCSTIESVSDACVLVDGENYYAVLCDAMLQARRCICLTGWQFDTRANLAPEVENQRLEFLTFLNSLCETNPELEIFITAWNYSVVYAIEREWFQNVRFALNAHERIHFRFLDHPERGAAHHEKIAIVDGVVAFTGGMDVCDERWDSREHRVADVRRQSARGTAYGPFHDVQLMLTGAVVSTLEDFFWQSWVQAGGSEGKRPPRMSHASWDPAALDSVRQRGLRLRASTVALSRTRIEDDERFEIEELLLRAVEGAERFIYVENQYFTSKAFVKALITRMRDEGRTKLDIVAVLPDGGHSKKEELVLGSRQRLMLWLIAELARTHGHQLRVLKSCGEDETGNRVATYIHSKVAIIDERFVTIGSANLMNRSMRVDHELNVSFDVEMCATGGEKHELAEDIRRLRASLIAEHAGCREEDAFLDMDRLLAEVDRRCEDAQSKLWPQQLERPREDERFFIAFCDPAQPLDWNSVQDAVDSLFDSDQSVVKGAARRVGQRLGVVDIEEDTKRATG